MMEIKFSVPQLSKITGLSQNDLEELLKGEDGEPLENAPGIIADKVGERIGKIKQLEFDKARSKTAKALESIVRSAGIEDFENVEEAVKALADKANEKGDGKSISLETLKQSDLAKVPAFIAFKDVKELELTTLKAEYDKTIKAQKASTIISKAKEEALSILSENGAKFTNFDKQFAALVKMIGESSLDNDDQGNTILKDGDEIRLDTHHNPVKYKDTVLQEWKDLFGLDVIDTSKRTPQPAQRQGQQQQQTGIKFDSFEAADKAIRTAGSAQDRLELQKAMKQQFPDGKPK
jgi:hypothetical protein